MVAKDARILAIWAAISFVPALAVAQTAPGPAAPSAPPAAPEASGSAAPAGSLGSFSWGPTKPARGRGWTRRNVAGPDATLPGFESLADGTTRLFVQLTKSVPVEERKAHGSVTYVLKGAHVGIWNNTNALVTTHFNTPVSRARLVPHGKDLFFVVELRANVTPTWKMTATKDNTAMLQVEFPKGDFAGGPAAPAAPAASSAPAPAPSATAPR